jgi:hypothetical protein
LPCSWVTGQQRTELFIGGLPDHIRVDVELQAPQDLQTVMHYARAYERRAQAVQQLALGRGRCPAARPPPATMGTSRPNPAAPANPAPAATRPFRRLTPAEQVERLRLGLRFNCDETYGPGHICPRLFYLETVDDTEADTSTEASDELPLPPPGADRAHTRHRSCQGVHGLSPRAGRHTP